MPLANGFKLGPYEIIAPLGAGGMGEVYRARDTRLDRTVAIKILPPELSDDATRRQRFEREAKVISSLNHPHICTLHDVGRQDGVEFIVMEYLEGESLAQRLEKGPLPAAQVLQYGTQIASALDRAHRNGVTHRDLKPGNIMLTKSGAKLLDFGLAKADPALAVGATLTDMTPRASPMTQQGTIVGTVPYMSPEQVEGKDVDARSDIFSLGAVLYEMVTGRRAFQGKSEFSVASAILSKDPELISTLQPLTPPALERTIQVCLAKEPDERWQSAGDLWKELRWLSEGGSQTGTRDGWLSADGKFVLARGSEGQYSVYPIAGGEPQPVPGLTEADVLAQWSADGRSVLAYRRSEIPYRLDRVDLATGHRTPFKELAPADRVGLLSMRGIFVTDDLRSYAYTAYYQVSSLFVSEGRQ